MFYYYLVVFLLRIFHIKKYWCLSIIFILLFLLCFIFLNTSQEQEKRRSMRVEESPKEKMNLIANKQTILNEHVKGVRKIS